MLVHQKVLMIEDTQYKSLVELADNFKVPEIFFFDAFLCRVSSPINHFSLLIADFIYLRFI